MTNIQYRAFRKLNPQLGLPTWNKLMPKIRRFVLRSSARRVLIKRTEYLLSREDRKDRWKICPLIFSADFSQSIIDQQPYFDAAIFADIKPSDSWLAQVP